MAASGAALAAMIQSSVNSRLSAVSGTSPLSQKDPSYFIQMCSAIGNGLIEGGPSISFDTNDTGSAGVPPIPGTGAGIGIVPNANVFVPDLYTRIRGYITAQFGNTTHDAYPPSAGNSGQYLLAICEGINDAIVAYYPTAWTLVSSHPDVYAGTGRITAGNFSGLDATAIQSQIVSLGSKMQGEFWPKMAQAISESYVSLITVHSTGRVTITGICVPGPSQVCGERTSGNGSGVAT